MLGSLAQPLPYRHARFMPSTRKVDDDVAQMGLAVKAIREGLRDHGVHVTQAMAADALDPPVTAQYWGLIEQGRVPQIRKPAYRQKLAEALNRAYAEAAGRPLAPPVTPDDIAGVATASPQLARLARMARELVPHDPADRVEAVFPLREGEVVIQIPANLTPAGFRQLEDFFALFLKANAPPQD